MVGTMLSSLGGWWNRLFGRNARSRILPDAWPAIERAEPPPPQSSDATLELAPVRSAPPERAAVVEPVPVTPEDAKRCLIEVLGVESLSASPFQPHTADPNVRQRTLAALDSLRQIPALQSLAQGFLRAMSRQEVSVSEVISAIEKDSALCVRVLRMANSVLVSPERRIEDLDTAVQMLGVARVRKAAQALFTLRDGNRVAAGFDWRHLWIHALGTAAIAEELEKQFRANDDSQVHLAGLLHDVGKIVLSTIAPDTYRDILITTWNESGRLEDLERERLGVDHREAGVMFAEHNSLPPSVIAAIAHHDRPDQARKFQFEVALVAIANHLSKAHGLGFSGTRLDPADGEFGDLPAWAIVEEACGFRPNIEALEYEMDGFITALRSDLRTLREESA